MKYWERYARNLYWCDYDASLATEYQQCLEEGLDVEELKPVVDAAAALAASDSKLTLADALYEILEARPVKDGYPYVEPSDLDGIRACRTGGDDRLPLPSDDVLRDRMRGAWYGRICGCQLGKPLEGVRSWTIEAYCKATGNWPISRYIDDDAEAGKATGFHLPRTSTRQDLEKRGYAPIDDDTNYTVTALKLLEKFGRDFKPEDVACEWIENATIHAYCTAERAAYRNFIAGIQPPDSASYRNPYREWIGAQIRADLFGWVNPGDPAKAAGFAFRDASISHIKNGIYGEMFIAACNAAAFCLDDVRAVLLAGLAQIPAKSRLMKDVTSVVDLHDSGASWDDFLTMLRASWDENNGHHWCHTNSNAMIVAAALLWCKDYTDLLRLSVIPGFDTDCNAATAGSIYGILNGRACIEDKWTAPIKGTLQTSIRGYELVSIDEMAERTIRLIG